VFPDVASLPALPPLALFCWFWVTLPPVAEELFVALASDTAFESPDVAVPCFLLEPDVPLPLLLEVASACPLLLHASSDLAPALLSFTALPLFETLWLAEPPLPPVEELLALPELPDVAVDLSAPFPDP
jgi:hypothetical protein